MDEFLVLCERKNWVMEKNTKDCGIMKMNDNKSTMVLFRVDTTFE
jgi:hypothetical protein